jgi:hypothetical protein
VEQEDFRIGTSVLSSRFESSREYSCGIDDEKVAALEKSSDVSKAYVCSLFRLTVVDEESRIITRSYR